MTTHAEKEKLRQKKWYEENLDRARKTRREYAKRYRKLYPERRLWSGAKNRSRLKNIDFSIEIEDIIIPSVCPVFGVPMIVGTPFAPSLDRVDSTKGYIKDNIQVISWKANAMKQDATPEELEKFANWIKNLKT